MTKYMIRARYTQSGWSGAVEEGFTSREDHVRDVVQSLGGTTELFYFAYGVDDVLVVADMEPTAAAALSMVVNRSGKVELSTTPLLTASEMDEARSRLPDYRPPGG